MLKLTPLFTLKTPHAQFPCEAKVPNVRVRPWSRLLAAAVEAVTVAPPVTTVVPVPTIEPPSHDIVAEKPMVTVPVPPSVPPFRISIPVKVRLPLEISVPPAPMVMPTAAEFPVIVSDAAVMVTP